MLVVSICVLFHLLTFVFLWIDGEPEPAHSCECGAIYAGQGCPLCESEHRRI